MLDSTLCNKNKKIWWMNIGIEVNWNNTDFIPKISNRENNGIIQGTEQLCLLLADSQDIVILNKSPDELIIENLKKLGIMIPEIWIVADRGTPLSECILNNSNLMKQIFELNKEMKVQLIPYGVSRTEEKIQQITGCAMFGPTYKQALWINSKVNARILSKKLGFNTTEGYICNTISELQYYGKLLFSESINTKVVLKENYGASGKGLLIFSSYRSFSAFIKRSKVEGKDLNIIIEKWYETIIDLNYQIIIEDSGHVNYVAPKEQLMSSGKYIGSRFPIYLDKEVSNILKKSAYELGDLLHEKGYRGIFSIDAIIDKNKNIYPLIEINGRFSLSTYLSRIPEYVGLDKHCLVRYYDLGNEWNLNYISKLLSTYLYDAKTKTGVIFSSFTQGSNNVKSRLFVVLIETTQYKVELLKNSLDEILIKRNVRIN